MFYIFSLLVLYFWLQIANAECDSFDRSCSAKLGEQLGNRIYDISARNRFFITYPISNGVENVNVLSTLFYGNIAIYAAFDRTPKLRDYDVTNSDFSFPQEYISVKIRPNANSLNIMIFAVSNVSFSVVLADVNTALTLSPAMPQFGNLYSTANNLHSDRRLANSKNVAYCSVASYKFLPLTVEAVVVLLTPLSAGGDVDLFVSGGKDNVVKSDNDGYVGDSVLFTPSHDNLASGILVTVKLRCSADSASVINVPYSIVVGDLTTNNPIRLLGGYGLEDSTSLTANSDESYRYYVLPVSGSKEDVVISLNTIMGEADLYINPAAAAGVDKTCFYSPDGSTALPKWLSNSAGSDAVSIGRNDLKGVRGSPGAYCITVFSHGNTKYSLYGFGSSTVVTLNDGQMMQDYISANTYHYFRYFDSDALPTIRGDQKQNSNPFHSLEVDVNPTVGDADLFIGCDIYPTGDDSGFPSKDYAHYNYTSRSAGEDSLSISMAPENPLSCQYQRNSSVVYIAVYGYSDSRVQVSLVHDEGIMTLVDGIPVVERVIYKRLKQFYRLHVGFEAEDITISSSPSSGDVDIFASFGHVPSESDFDYSSRTLGSGADIIKIPETKVKCQDCWLYVTVMGFQTSRYSLVYTLTDSLISLTDGIPLLGSVASGDIQYYMITLPISSLLNYTVTAVVTTLSGAPLLFASNRINFPNRTSAFTTKYTQSVSGSFPVSTLKILNNDLNSFPNVYIGVGGDDFNSTYSIRAHYTYASAEEMVSEDLDNLDVSSDTEHPFLFRLLDGVPQNDAIHFAGGSNPGLLIWKFYQIPYFAGHESLDVRLTTLIGEVDVYLGKCPFQTSDCDTLKDGKPLYLPTQQNFLATTAGQDQDYLTYARKDNSSGSFIIGIISTNIYSEYSLSVSFQNTVLSLQSGISVSDHVGVGEYDYFSFEFASMRSQDTDDDGLGSVAMLQISITVYYGDPDLYISTVSSNPTKGGNTTYWFSSLFGSDTITIDPTNSNDKHACLDCTYYIGVLGAADASYSITASVVRSRVNPSDLVHLQDGVPAASVVIAHMWKYYVFYYQKTNLALPDVDIKITLTSFVGDADLYVNLVNTNLRGNATDLEGKLPTSFNFQYTSGSTGSRDDSIFISHLDDNYLSSCKTTGHCAVLLGVFGFELTEFGVTISTSVSATQLQMGVPVSTSVAAGSYSLYKLLFNNFNTTGRTGVQISTTQFSGHVCGYILCSINGAYAPAVPDEKNYYWSINVDQTGSVIDILNIELQERKCFSAKLEGSLIIAYKNCRADNSATTFSISSAFLTKSMDETLPSLIEGVPTSSSVTYHNMRYYMIQFLPNSLYNDMSIRFTVSSGVLSAYVSNSWTTRPYFDSSTNSVKSYLFSTLQKTSLSGNTEYIKVNHQVLQKSCPISNTITSCYIVLGVFGEYLNNRNTSKIYDSTSFAVTYYYEDSTTILQSGVPVTSNVFMYEFEYFKFTATVPKADLVVTMTPLSGDPDMYIAVAPIVHPNRGNFTWMSAALGTDALTIQYDSIKKHCHGHQNGLCDFYIGVYGWQNSSYSIVASMNEGFGNPILLLDGQPQNGHADRSQVLYYKYFVTAYSSSSLPQNIKISLTSTEAGADMDLYVTLSDREKLPFEKADDDFSAIVNPYPENQNVAFLEPGMSNYDYKSTNFGGVVDEIVIEAGSPNYCINCYVYIAVIGFFPGTYTIVAGSTGFSSMLQNGVAQGNHVNASQYVYYTIHNDNPLAVITISVTTVAGDTDVYVTPFKSEITGGTVGKSNLVRLPTSASSTWGSTHVGEDTLIIRYSDDKFCFNCDYIIGVYGFTNATYTILVTTSEDRIIQLVENRPQIVSITSSSKSTTGGTRYFYIPINTDLADVTVGVTSLDTSVGDVYVQCYSSVLSGADLQLPNPLVAKSFIYSSVGTTDSTVVIPHTIFPQYGEDVGCIAAVHSYAFEMRFTILVTGSLAAMKNNPIILQSGIPQDHHVGKGQTLLFRYFPSDVEDIHISVSARSGDPDLLVALDADQVTLPTCSFMSTSQWERNCTGDIIWSSFMYHTDQIIISHDFPCSPVLSSTVIDKTKCNTNAKFLKAGAALIIGVFGYSNSKFTLLVTTSGQHVILQPGRTQIASTSSGFVCSFRDLSSGACVKSKSGIVRAMEVSYFTFFVNPSSYANNGIDANNYGSGSSSVLFSVAEKCNTTVSYDASGTVAHNDCVYNPLRIVVNSCPRSKCNIYHMFPSPLVDQHKAEVFLTANGGASKGATVTASTTLFLQRDAMVENTDDFIGMSSSGFCDADVAKEPCVYYVAVDANSNSNNLDDDNLEDDVIPMGDSAPRTFSITARTPGDIVSIPCDYIDSSADGIRTTSMESLESGRKIPGGSLSLVSRKFYEICVNSLNIDKFDGVWVSLEQCTGSSSMFACNDDVDNPQCHGLLPSTDNWSYSSNGQNSCVKDLHSGNSPKCNSMQYHPSFSLANTPLLRLPLTVDSLPVGSYSVMVEGTGEYILRAQYTKNNQVFSPLLIPDEKENSMKVTFSKVSGDSAVIHWTPVKVQLVRNEAAYRATNMRFKIYLIDRTKMQATSSIGSFRVDTLCGLVHFAEANPDIVSVVDVISAASSNFVMSYVLNNLNVNTQYGVILTASCDSDCLRQVSKTIPGSVGVSAGGVCSGALNCQSQDALYEEVMIKTKSTVSTNESFQLSSTFYVVILVAVISLILLGVAFCLYKRLSDVTTRVRNNMYEMNRDAGESHSYRPVNPIHAETEVYDKKLPDVHEASYTPPRLNIFGKSKDYSKLSTSDDENDGVNV